MGFGGGIGMGGNIGPGGYGGAMRQGQALAGGSSFDAASGYARQGPGPMQRRRLPRPRMPFTPTMPNTPWRGGSSDDGSVIPGSPYAGAY